MKSFRNSSASTRNSARNSNRRTSFYCHAPTVQSVEIAGDFNHWLPAPMNRQGDGWWCYRVRLCHGHHQYRFRVGGKSMLDPSALDVGRDESGEQVSLLDVS